MMWYELKIPKWDFKLWRLRVLNHNVPMMIFYQFNLTIHPYIIVIIKPMQRYENKRFRIKINWINSNILFVRNVSLRKELYRSILGLTSMAKNGYEAFAVGSVWFRIFKRLKRIKVENIYENYPIVKLSGIATYAWLTHHPFIDTKSLNSHHLRITLQDNLDSSFL